MRLKRICRRVILLTFIFVITTFLFLKYINLVRYPKTGLYDFYKCVGRNTIDVLCVGSSHVYCSINPVQMYDNYGIAAYDLSAGSQAIWNSYYYIKEALKTQAPSVVVLDVYTLIYADKHFDSKVEGNLLNMKFSYNKWEALKAAETEKYLDIFFEFPIVHSRYKQLNKEDFNEDKNNNFFLGYSYQNKVIAYNPEQIYDGRGGV